MAEKIDTLGPDSVQDRTGMIQVCRPLAGRTEKQWLALAESLGQPDWAWTWVPDPTFVIASDEPVEATIPERCELYRHFDAAGVLLYVGISYTALMRLAQHRKSHWFDTIAGVTIERHATRQDALAAEARAIARENPLHNIARPAVPNCTPGAHQCQALALAIFALMNTGALDALTVAAVQACEASMEIV